MSQHAESPCRELGGAPGIRGGPHQRPGGAFWLGRGWRPNVTVREGRPISVQSGPLGARSCEHPDVNAVDRTSRDAGGPGVSGFVTWGPWKTVGTESGPGTSRENSPSRRVYRDGYVLGTTPGLHVKELAYSSQQLQGPGPARTPLLQTKEWRQCQVPHSAGGAGVQEQTQGKGMG